ncbi:MAG: peptidoglycan-binding protein, partial [Hyphomicrobiales bacterium]
MTLPEPVHARGLDFLGLFEPRETKPRDAARDGYNSNRRNNGFFRMFRQRRRTAPVEEIVEKPYVPPVYRPDPLAPLRDAKLEGERPDDAMSAAIWDNLVEGGEPVIRVHPTHRKPILEFYQARGFKPLWVIEQGLTRRADRLLALLAIADEEALTPSDYLPEALGSYEPSEREISNAAVDLARLDIELTVAAVKYAHHASGGRVVPSRMSKYIDLQPTPVAPAAALTALDRTVRPDAYLAALHPKHAFYADLKRALAKYRAAAGNQSEFRIPEGGLIRQGNTDDRVPVLRQKLEAIGLLEPAEEYVPRDLVSRRELVHRERDGAEESAYTDGVSDDTVYNADIVAAVKTFQKRHGLSPDGVVGPATTRALNGDSFVGRIEKIVLNMERARWLPHSLGKRHVFVNQTNYQMRLVENGKTIHRARVIVGKRKHQTPSFSDEMETVVFNPYWNVPRSIA